MLMWRFSGSASTSRPWQRQLYGVASLHSSSAQRGPRELGGRSRIKFSTIKHRLHIQKRCYRIFAKSVIVPNDSSVTESSLLSTLPQWSKELAGESQQPTDVIFLVTPKLAPLIAAGSTFLSNALLHIFEKYGAEGVDSVSTRSLAAIIDKVPGAWNDDEQRHEACEGISVLHAARAVTRGLDASSQYRSQSSGSQSLLTISSTPSASSLITTGLSIPLANTLFITGQPSTLLSITSTISFSSPQTPIIQHLNTERAHNATITLPSASSWTPSSHLPLQRLTEPRQVREAMGNIVREIDINGTTVPASTELESVVMGNVKKMPREVVDAKTRIYALIQPSPTRSSEAVKAESRESFPTAFLSALQHGARLHQVIGGGGGWGSKKGLLALDPTGFDSGLSDSVGVESTRRPPWEADDHGNEKESGDRIVREGEWIEFWQLSQNFIPKQSPPSLGNSVGNGSIENKDTEGNSGHENEGQTIVFGTIPSPDSLDTSLSASAPSSSASASPSSSSSPTDTSSPSPSTISASSPSKNTRSSTETSNTPPDKPANTYISVANTFGALSEGALHIAITSPTKSTLNSTPNSSPTSHLNFPPNPSHNSHPSAQPISASRKPRTYTKTGTSTDSSKATTKTTTTNTQKSRITVPYSSIRLHQPQ